MSSTITTSDSFENQSPHYESTHSAYYEVEEPGGVEDPNGYYRGGFHPVALGDRLGENGRFRVVAKLGNGAFGIVWLCHDSLIQKWRAVKILSARVSIPTAEIKRHEIPHYRLVALSDMVVWRYLADLLPPNDPTLHRHHIFMPLEPFWIHGPNGDHLCEVLPLLGPTLSAINDACSPCPALLRNICHQLVDSMAFLHRHGICHDDFRPANILLQLLDGTDELPEADIMKIFGIPETTPVYAETDEDGDDYEIESNVPPYLVKTAKIDWSLPVYSTQIAVVDFGVAYFTDDPPTISGIPPAWAAPEAIFRHGGLGPPADVWALACTILYVMTDEDPFTEEYDNSLCQIVKSMEYLMGPLPLCYRPLVETRLKPGSRYKTRIENSLNDASLCVLLDPFRTAHGVPDGEWKGVANILQHQLMSGRSVPWSEEEYEMMANQDRVWELTGRLPRFIKPADERREWRRLEAKTEAEVSDLLDLLLRIFRWEPSQRASAEELLAHTWFNNSKPTKSGFASSASQWLITVIETFLYRWFEASPQGLFTKFLMAEHSAAEETPPPTASLRGLHHKDLSYPSHLILGKGTKAKHTTKQGGARERGDHS